VHLRVPGQMRLSPRRQRIEQTIFSSRFSIGSPSPKNAQQTVPFPGSSARKRWFL
jgi:hypothetical protein